MVLTQLHYHVQKEDIECGGMAPSVTHQRYSVDLQPLPRMPRRLNSPTKRQKPLVRTALFGWASTPSVTRIYSPCWSGVQWLRPQLTRDESLPLRCCCYI